MILGSAATSASLVTSHTTGKKSDGAMATAGDSTSCCSSCRRSLRRATATTRSPARPKASHTAQPMPGDAGQTQAHRQRQRSACNSGAGRLNATSSQSHCQHPMPATQVHPCLHYRALQQDITTSLVLHFIAEEKGPKTLLHHRPTGSGTASQWLQERSNHMLLATCMLCLCLT